MSRMKQGREATAYWIKHWNSLLMAERNANWMVENMNSSVNSEARQSIEYAAGIKKRVAKSTSLLGTSGEFVRLRYIRGMTAEEIAECTHYALSNVKRQTIAGISSIAFMDRMNGNRLTKQDTVLQELAEC